MDGFLKVDNHKNLNCKSDSDTNNVKFIWIIWIICRQYSFNKFRYLDEL